MFLSVSVQSLFFYADLAFLLNILLANKHRLKSTEDKIMDRFADFLVIGVLRRAFQILFDVIRHVFGPLKGDVSATDDMVQDVVRAHYARAPSGDGDGPKTLNVCLNHIYTVTSHVSRIFPYISEPALLSFCTPAIRDTFLWIFDSCFELLPPDLLHQQSIVTFFAPVCRMIMRITFTDEGERLFCSDHFINDILMNILVHARDADEFNYVLGVLRNLCYAHGQPLLAGKKPAVHAIVTALNASATAAWLDNVAGLAGNLCTNRPDMQKMFFDHPDFLSAYPNLPFQGLSPRHAIVVEACYCIVLQAAPTETEGSDILLSLHLQASDGGAPFAPFPTGFDADTLVRELDVLLKEGARCVELMANPLFLASVISLEEKGVHVEKKLHGEIVKTLREEMARKQKEKADEIMKKQK